MLLNRLAPLGIAALVLAGCASDEAPDDQITPDSVLDDGLGDGIDTDVDDGIDTEVEVSENLGFDEPDEG